MPKPKNTKTQIAFLCFWDCSINEYEYIILHETQYFLHRTQLLRLDEYNEGDSLQEQGGVLDYDVE